MVAAAASTLAAAANATRGASWGVAGRASRASPASIRALHTTPLTHAQPAPATAHLTTQNPSYPLYPSVHTLLTQHRVPHADIPKIRATGPNGRLLKGDVLCYLGAIPDKNHTIHLAEIIDHRAHLDLSGIKIAPPPAAPQEAAAAAVPPTPAPAAPTTTTVSLRIPLAPARRVQAQLADHRISLDTILSRATKDANQALPLSAAQRKRRDEEVLWDSILGVQTVKARGAGRATSVGGYVPKMTSGSAGGKGKVQKEDIIDVLSGKSGKGGKKVVEAKTVGEEDVKVFEVTVPVADKGRGEAFLERLKEALEAPEKLVGA